MRGMEVVRKIEQVSTDDGGKRKCLVIITACGELSASEIPNTSEAKKGECESCFGVDVSVLSLIISNCSSHRNDS